MSDLNRLDLELKHCRGDLTGGRVGDRGRGAFEYEQSCSGDLARERFAVADYVGALGSIMVDVPQSRRSYRTTWRPPRASAAQSASGQESMVVPAREQNEWRRRLAEVLDPERDAVGLDRRHETIADAMTPPGRKRRFPG